jgi:U32 family peptidase
MNTAKFIPEILSPAGNLDKLMTACRYGADAVYVGGPRYGLRSGAENFSDEELRTGVEFAHSRGVKLYLTLNAFLHEADLEGLATYASFLEELKVDALIVSDPGVMDVLSKACDIPLHVSTQATVLNSSEAKLWKDLGATRIITGRELSLEEGADLCTGSGMEVEMFVMGAMCSAFSGHCTISNYTAGRDSNRGGCKQSCRFDFQIEGTEGSRALMSSKDLNGLEHLGTACELGIHSLKIEGRMKSSLYVAGATKAFREAIDAICQEREVPARCHEQLTMFSNRGYTEASLGSGTADEGSIAGDGSGAGPKFAWAGQVIGVSTDHAWVQLKNPLLPSEALEAITFEGENQIVETKHLEDYEGNSLEKGRQESVLRFPRGVLEEGMILRKLESE